MALFKCKMCGGTLEINNNETVAICEYCGTRQTLPKLDDDRRANLYDRANHFRRNNEFDKAMGIYEQILNEDNADAEAYWSLVLCRYGIEYDEDFPAGGMNLRNVLTDVDVKNRADIQRNVLPVGANGKQIRVLQSGHLSCLTHASACLS